MTYGSMPGEATVSRPGPLFPAAATTTRPRRHAISTAADIGSVRYDVGVGAPNERLMTRMLYATRWARTHSIPRTTEEIRPLPVLLSTRTSTMLASGAMPTNSPADRAPFPAMIPRTSVPCAPASAQDPSSAQLADAGVLP